MLVSVIPCYNNGGSIGALVREMGAYVDGVVVVDDGSADSTQEEAKAAGARVIRLERNKGKAEAVRTGLRCALYELNADEILTHLDGDGEHKPADVPLLRRAYKPKTVVIGNRNYMSGDTRHILYYMLIGFLDEKTGVRLADPLCGFRLFGKDFAEIVLENSKSERFGLELEEIFLAIRNGYSIKEARLSSLYKRCKPTSVIVKAERELDDNVRTILEYADFLNISEREMEDMLYAFYGKSPDRPLKQILNDLSSGKIDS